MGGQIFADDAAIRTAAAEMARLAGRTREAAGELSPSCALNAATGQAAVSAAIDDFVTAWSQEMTVLQQDCADLGQKALVAADTYVSDDLSVMPWAGPGTGPGTSPGAGTGAP